MKKTFTNGYTIMPNKAFEELNSSEIMILHYFINKFKLNDNKAFYCYNAWMMKHFKCSKRTIIRYIKHLEELEYISIEKQGRINYYSINEYVYANEKDKQEPQQQQQPRIIGHMKVAAAKATPSTPSTVKILKINNDMQNLNKETEDIIFDRLLDIYTNDDKDEQKTDYYEILNYVCRFFEDKAAAKKYLKDTYIYISNNYNKQGNLIKIDNEIKQAAKEIVIPESDEEMIALCQIDINKKREKMIEKGYEEYRYKDDREIAIELEIIKEQLQAAI